MVTIGLAIYIISAIRNANCSGGWGNMNHYIETY